MTPRLLLLVGFLMVLGPAVAADDLENDLKAAPAKPSLRVLTIRSVTDAVVSNPLIRQPQCRCIERSMTISTRTRWPMADGHHIMPAARLGLKRNIGTASSKSLSIRTMPDGWEIAHTVAFEIDRVTAYQIDPP